MIPVMQIIGILEAKMKLKGIHIPDLKEVSTGKLKVVDKTAPHFKKAKRNKSSRAVKAWKAAQHPRGK